MGVSQVHESGYQPLLRRTEAVEKVHRGLHAIPAQVWDRTIKHRRRPVIANPTRFVIDCACL
jgi:hypothetical protein